MKDAAWCYPSPKTHVHVRNCVTFKTGRGIIVSRDTGKSLCSLQSKRLGQAAAENPSRVVSSDGPVLHFEESADLDSMLPKKSDLRTAEPTVCISPRSAKLMDGRHDSEND